MEVEMRIRFGEGELHEMKDVVAAIDEVATRPIAQLDLEPIEEVVLRAVREEPGRAARSVHKNAAVYEECPVEWVNENSPEREAIKDALHDLRDKGLVELNERSWYPR